MHLQFPRILWPLWSSKLIWRQKSPSSKVVYLTFDDGPIPELTPVLLDLLDEYGIKATFFCVGENVMRYPQLYEEIIVRGHRTGNHSFNHIKGFATRSTEYFDNVAKASQYISSDLFRPPYGQITRKQIEMLAPHYRIVMWDVISYDYQQSISPENILRIIRRKTRNGSIIVFHDSLKARNNLLATLPRSIEYLHAAGFRFALL